MSGRRLLKDLLIYGGGEILLKASAFLTLPLYTRLLAPADYGVWSFVTTAAALVTTVLGLGGETAYSRFFHEAKSEEDRQRLTSTWLAFLSAWSLGLTLLLLPATGALAGWSLGTPQHGGLFALAMLAVPVGLINGTCAQVLRNRFEASAFVVLNVFSTLLSIAASLVGAFVLHLGLAGILGGALVAALVMLPVRLYTVKDMLRPRFSGTLLGDFLRFGAPLVPTALAYWIFAASDRLMLAKLSSVEQIGLYAVAIQVTSALNMVNVALGQAWGPYAIRMHEESPEAASVFFGRAMTYLLMGFGLLCVLLTAFAQDVVALVAAPSFSASAAAIGPLALAMAASATTQVTALGISLTKKTGYLALYAWGVALLNVVLNLWFLPRWGMLGASVSMAIAYGVLSAAYLIKSQKLLPVRYEGRRAAVTIGLTLAATVALSVTPLPQTFGGLLLKASTAFAYLALLIALGALDRRDGSLLRAWWLDVRQRRLSPTS